MLAAASTAGILGTLLGAPAKWLLVWAGVLLLLLALVVRWSPVRPAVVAGALGMVAVSAWPVPLVWESSSWLEICGVVGFWVMPAVGAALAGGHLRRQAGRLEQAVLTHAEIGAELFITAGTAKTHIANVQAKLGVRNRVGIASWAWEHGVVGAEGSP